VVTLRSAKYTRADYERLPEGFPAELMDGQLIKEPSPLPWHQLIAQRLLIALGAVVGERRAYIAPVDVFIDDLNVLQPDVLVVPKGSEPGPETTEIALPELVVEVFSPSSRVRDRRIKSGTYLRAGVREVWLVDPAAQTIEVCSASGSRSFRDGEQAPSTAVPGFSLVPDDLFRV
jgi:Uma2 family endonuclease